MAITPAFHRRFMTVGMQHPQSLVRYDTADSGDKCPGTARQIQNGCLTVRRRAETQLVVITTSQHKFEEVPGIGKCTQ